MVTLLIRMDLTLVVMLGSPFNNFGLAGGERSKGYHFILL